jgi:hypothetical protein
MKLGSQIQFLKVGSKTATNLNVGSHAPIICEASIKTPTICEVK